MRRTQSCPASDVKHRRRRPILGAARPLDRRGDDEMTAFSPRRRALLGATAALATTPLLARPALAQGTWPDRPVRLIVGFAAGGPNHIPPRRAAQGFQEILGQPVVVENRPGAAGNLGSEAVVRAPA